MWILLMEECFCWSKQGRRWGGRDPKGCAFWVYLTSTHPLLPLCYYGHFVVLTSMLSCSPRLSYLPEQQTCASNWPPESSPRILDRSLNETPADTCLNSPNLFLPPSPISAREMPFSPRWKLPNLELSLITFFPHSPPPDNQQIL